MLHHSTFSIMMAVFLMVSLGALGVTVLRLLRERASRSRACEALLAVGACTVFGGLLGGENWPFLSGLDVALGSGLVQFAAPALFKGGRARRVIR